MPIPSKTDELRNCLRCRRPLQKEYCKDCDIDWRIPDLKEFERVSGVIRQKPYIQNREE